LPDHIGPARRTDQGPQGARHLSPVAQSGADRDRGTPVRGWPMAQRGGIVLLLTEGSASDDELHSVLTKGVDDGQQLWRSCHEGVAHTRPRELSNRRTVEQPSGTSASRRAFVAPMQCRHARIAADDVDDLAAFLEVRSAILTTQNPNLTLMRGR